MTGTAHQKVNAGHLKRNAYLYVRQSTLRQVFENTESTKRQYGLRQHAVALGWPVERIIVIDSDLGQSGASAVDREGFQKLVTEVGLGKAGIVLGLEVSRLARNSTDWHRLLEICALTDTLILDEDGVYDPVALQRSSSAGPKGDHERSRTARAPGPSARWNPEQSTPRRVAMSLAGWLSLQRQQPAGAGPRPTGAGEHSILFRYIPAHRIGLRGGQSFSPEGAFVSTTVKEGAE